MRRAALAAALGLLWLTAVAAAPARQPPVDGGTAFGTPLPVGCTAPAGAVVGPAGVVGWPESAALGGGPAQGDGGPGSGGAAAAAATPAAAVPSDAVALSFDDGPSLTYTPQILAILDRLGARATFFAEGRHVAGREALLRRIVASGDEIGNHSYRHSRYPDAADLAATDAAIRAATAFEPCLFRPPYGLVSRQLVAAARRDGLELVLWTLDSDDDHHPGVAAIRRRVLRHARPGSIVLMHDGGHHPQTVAALPSIIRGLQARGLRLVTVSELLGGSVVYR